MRSVRNVLSFVIFQCLGASAWALGFSANGEKVKITSCAENICYKLSSESILTSQFGPMWSLTEGQLEVWTRGLDKGPQNSRFHRFKTGTWDQLGQIYHLRSDTKRIFFDAKTGSLKVELLQL